jgi:hypothetical protein
LITGGQDVLDIGWEASKTVVWHELFHDVDGRRQVQAGPGRNPHFPTAGTPNLYWLGYKTAVPADYYNMGTGWGLGYWWPDKLADDNYWNPLVVYEWPPTAGCARDNWKAIGDWRVWAASGNWPTLWGRGGISAFLHFYVAKGSPAEFEFLVDKAVTTISQTNVGGIGSMIKPGEWNGDGTAYLAQSPPSGIVIPETPGDGSTDPEELKGDPDLDGDDVWQSGVDETGTTLIDDIPQSDPEEEEP